MLQKVDKRTSRLLDLARHIDGLEDEDFCMGVWESCICGHACRKYGASDRTLATGAELLDIPTEDALLLFCPPLVSNKTDRTEAVRVLRHYALTGEVAWKKAPTENMLTLTSIGMILAGALMVPAALVLHLL